MRPNGRHAGVFEVDNEFYEEWDKTHFDLAEAAKDIVIYTDGLSALEKKLMKQVDDAYYEQCQKRMPEYMQRREAKASPLYLNAIRAKAAAIRRQIILRGRVEMFKMKFEEWRTRSADRRNSI